MSSSWPPPTPGTRLGPLPTPGRPRPAPIASPRFAAVALIAGLVAGITFDSSALGLNVLLVAIALGVAARMAPRPRADRWSIAWTALALGLALTAVLRDATWVVLPSLLAAIAYGSLAVAGGATATAVMNGFAAAFERLPAGPFTVARSAAPALPRVARSRAVPALRGVVLGTALLAVFGVLFASADRAFAEIAGRAIPTIDDLGPLPGHIFWFAIAVALAGALAAAGSRPGGYLTEPGSPARQLGAVEWTIALVALNGLFAAFVAVQATVLFGRDDHVLRTAGLTYAEYAREGFGQLVLATVLTLAVVGGAQRWARTDTAPQRFALKLLQIVLCGLALVVLASALHRLDLYQDAFGASRLRLAADGFSLTIGGVLALTIVALAAPRAAWLPRACALLAGVALLLFGLSDPDRRVADRNVDRYERTGDIDVVYLGGLSADAVPELVRLPPHLRDQAVMDERVALREGDGWASTNLARRRARDLLGD